MVRAKRRSSVAWGACRGQCLRRAPSSVALWWLPFAGACLAVSSTLPLAHAQHQQAAEVDPDGCWSGIYDYARCCYARNPDCWDAEFTYKRCCSGRLGPFAQDASTLRLVDRLAAAGAWRTEGTLATDLVAVNLGAGDGVSLISGDDPGLLCSAEDANCDEVYGDPLYQLYTRRGFRGLAVEADPRYSDALRANLPENVSVRIALLDAQNVVDLVAAEDFPTLHVLKVDIDSHDCDVLLALLDAGFRPLMIQMEVNVEVPLPLSFAVHGDIGGGRFNAGAAYTGCFGCSLALLLEIANAFEYTLVGVGPAHDVLFVQRRLADLAELPTLGASEAMARLEQCCMSTHVGNVLWGSPAFDVFYSADFRAEVGVAVSEKERAVRAAFDVACKGDGEAPPVAYSLSPFASDVLRDARQRRDGS